MSTKESVKQSEKEAPRRAYCCRACLAPIASEFLTAINGKQRHTFANPGGEVFRIGCFKDTSHLYPIGEPSDQFTWFPGYTWQVVICDCCMRHLGWQFTGKDVFWGLIMERLMLLVWDEE